MNKQKSGVFYEAGERLFNGIIKENPTFVLMLGMCPTLAVTTSAINGLGMGLTTMVVLALSNLIISSLRKVIPNKIRIPAFIVIIASFVTVVELLLSAFIPSLYDALGLYIPLIVVNCIILGRAEAYAYSHKPLPSLFDGIGMGLGFSLALTIIGGFRELLGSGKIFGFNVMPDSFVPVSIFVMAPGAFFVLAMLTAIQNKIKEVGTQKGKDMSIIQSGCGGNCIDCNKSCKVETVISASEAHIVNSSNDEKLNLEELTNSSSKDLANKEELSESKETNLNGLEASSDIEEPQVTSKEKKKKKEKKVKEPKEKESKASQEKDQESKEEPKDLDFEESKPVEKASKVKEPKVKEPKVKEPKNKASKVSEDLKDSDDDMELLNLEELVNGSKTVKGKTNKTHKKAGVDKAKLLLSNAEETMKEESNND